jgi:hypothetical protein
VKSTRLVLVAAAAAILVGSIVPSSAAAAKTKTLYFDNNYTTGTGNSCTPQWQLTTSQPGDGNCNSIQAGAGGNGDLATNDYATISKATGYKVDTKRHLTGTVFVGQHNLFTDLPIKYLPGQVGADITISVNGKELGTASKSGMVSLDKALEIPIDFALPASLKGVKVTSVTASVAYTDGAGAVGVLYQDPTQSKLVVPTL